MASTWICPLPIKRGIDIRFFYLDFTSAERTYFGILLAYFQTRYAKQNQTNRDVCLFKSVYIPASPQPIPGIPIFTVIFSDTTETGVTSHAGEQWMKNFHSVRNAIKITTLFVLKKVPYNFVFAIYTESDTPMRTLTWRSDALIIILLTMDNAKTGGWGEAARGGGAWDLLGEAQSE